MEKYLLVFENVHETMEAESILKNFNIETKTIPTPRQVSLSCGISIIADINLKEDIDKIIKENRISPKYRYKFLNEIGNNKIVKSYE